MTILDAAVSGKFIAVSTYSETKFRLHILSIEDSGSLRLTVITTYNIDGEVTCLSLCRLEKGAVEVQAGLFQQGRPLLGRALIGGVLGSVDERLTILDPSACKSNSSVFLPYAPWP